MLEGAGAFLMVGIVGPASNRGAGIFGGAVTLTSGRCSSGCVTRVGINGATAGGGGAVGGAIVLEPIGKLGVSNAVSKCGRG